MFLISAVDYQSQKKANKLYLLRNKKYQAPTRHAALQYFRRTEGFVFYSKGKKTLCRRGYAAEPAK
jgi:hypothetical protein